MYVQAPLNEAKIKYNNKYFNKKFKLLTICSKNEIKSKLNFTTDKEKILDFLEHDNNKVILITYQSLGMLIDVVRENDFKIDLMCFDEAHHILGDGIKNNLFGTNEDIEKDEGYCENFIDEYVEKTLFFTATPKNSNNIKMFETHTEITIENDNFEIVDDENICYEEEPHCGDMIYEYMHIDGVNDNILNDFNIRVDLFTENTEECIFEAICRTIFETGNNRILTFHSRSESESNKFSTVNKFVTDENYNKLMKAYRKVLKDEFPHLREKYKNITFNGITSSTKDKNNILSTFDETRDDEIYILASCKTIGEGIDTKNANMVVFVDPKQSYIEIIQNIGRVCRKNANTKGLATVLIPAYVDVNKYKECKNMEEKDNIIRQEMSKTGNFNGILNVLSALRQEDPYMFELCLKYSESFTNKELSNNYKKNGLELNEKEITIDKLFEEEKIKYDKKKTENENLQNLAKKINCNIEILNKKIADENIFINNNSNETIHLVKSENGNYMKVTGKTNKNIEVNKPHRNIKPFCHTNEEIKILWQIDKNVNLDKKIFGGYIKSTLIYSGKEKWFEIFNKVKTYIDVHSKKPSLTDKKLEIRALGKWLSRQQSYYINNVYIMKEYKVRNSWTKFINDEKYKAYFLDNKTIWYNTLVNVCNYIDTNNKKPSETDKDEIKKMYFWLKHQTEKYKKCNEIMKEVDIRDLWSEFINNDKYKKYFLSSEDNWCNILDNVKKYMDDNNKKPSSCDANINIRKIGKWLSHQQEDYKKNKNIISEPNIKKLWENFVNDDKYKVYLLDNETIWYNILEQVKKYINDNNKRPSCSDKNSDVKKLGKWVTRQQEHYNKKGQNMKDKERLEWEKFITDDKYKKYFLENSDVWNAMLTSIKNYINQHNKKPLKSDDNAKVIKMSNWLSAQQANYKKNEDCMKDEKIKKSWEEFVNDDKYKIILLDTKETWYTFFENLKKYIDENNKLPSNTNDIEIKKLLNWTNCQRSNYKHNKNSMKDIKIKNSWKEFIGNPKYSKYFATNIDSTEITDNKKIKIVEDDLTSSPISTKSSSSKKSNIKIIEDVKSGPKSTTVKAKNPIHKQESEEQKRKRINSEYQELTKKMSTQKSTTTNTMFKEEPNLWHQYHDSRDFSFKGYDKQEEIPVNKIINYLSDKSNIKLKIADLGCGRNLIKQHFKANNKFKITGYDYVSFNESVACDITNLPDEDESLDVCIFSQSLMGSNWKEYINEAVRVLRYNGEMIISESIERYDTIIKYIEELGLHVKFTDNDKTNRWFYLFVINDKVFNKKK